MNAQFHHRIRRLGMVLAIATALTALVAAPGLGQGRPAASYYKPQDLQRMSDSWAARGGVLTNVPASSYYKPQDLQRMSDSWAARGGVLTNVPASSYYLPQQIETMSQSWAARGGLLPASAKVTTGRDGFDWSDFGIGAGAMLGLVLLSGGIATAVHYSRRSSVRPRTVS